MDGGFLAGFRLFSPGASLAGMGGVRRDADGHVSKFIAPGADGELDGFWFSDFRFLISDFCSVRMCLELVKNTV